MVWIVRAELKDNYKVFVEFNDGMNGIIDFKEKLDNDHRPIIKDLLDLEKFKTVKIGLDTLCWANGVDFAPEYIYERIIGENRKSA